MQEAAAVTRLSTLVHCPHPHPRPRRGSYCRPDFYYSLFTRAVPAKGGRMTRGERARARLWFIVRQITLSPYCASFAPDDSRFTAAAAAVEVAVATTTTTTTTIRRQQRQDEVPFWGLSPCFYIMLVHATLVTLFPFILFCSIPSPIYIYILYIHIHLLSI